MDTVSTNIHKKVRHKIDCYIKWIVFTVIILLSIIAIIMESMSQD